MDITVNHRKILHHGRVFDITLENVTVRKETTIDMEIIRHPGAAAIVPLTEDMRIIMLKQYRHAAGMVIWEIPAGTVHHNESTDACARRELEEETGYRAAQWKRLGSVIPVPGYSDESIDLFLARQLSASTQNLDADELIEVQRVPIATVLDMIARGRVNDAKTMAGIFRTIQHLGMPAI